jgi:hypothetical protein
MKWFNTVPTDVATARAAVAAGGMLATTASVVGTTTGVIPAAVLAVANTDGLKSLFFYDTNNAAQWVAVSQIRFYKIPPATP